MTDIRLSDAEWGKLRELLRQESRAYVGRDEDSCRRFVAAVKWMSRSGAQKNTARKRSGGVGAASVASSTSRLTG